MGAAALPLMAVATGISAVSSVMQGQAAKTASEFERQQYEEEAENNRVAAIQDENLRRRNLAATLAAQEVYFGANGLDPNSPMAQALRDETVGLAEDDIATAKLNFANRRRRNQLAAAQASAAGDAAEVGGWMNAAGGLLQFGSKWASTGSVPKAPSGGSTGLANYGMTKQGAYYG